MATEAEMEGGRGREGERETSSENIGITKINMNISGARRWSKSARLARHWILL
jgi:hypothetical protein